jgi:hypothetical protein
MVLGYPHLVCIDKSMVAHPHVLRTLEYVFLISSLGQGMEVAATCFMLLFLLVLVSGLNASAKGASHQEELS